MCLFIYDYSPTAGHDVAYERCQQLQCYKAMKNKLGDFAKTTALDRYGVKTSEKANMHNKHRLTSTRFIARSAHRERIKLLRDTYPNPALL